MRTVGEAEAAWQRARELAKAGNAAGAIDLVVEVAAFYEERQLAERAEAADEALDRVLAAAGAAEIWEVLDDRLLGPGEFASLGE